MRTRIQINQRIGASMEISQRFERSNRSERSLWDAESNKGAARLWRHTSNRRRFEHGPAVLARKQFRVSPQTVFVSAVIELRQRNTPIFVEGLKLPVRFQHTHDAAHFFHLRSIRQAL